ncbi:MAG: flavodoxin-dependent (E)-4-hydroxy-3-methylbut-2-enyl-diphosphate synthase, partial [Daejeonella sp.]|uniref:flavodoxin-dependent (E)-4-hydroxy-3-methylbut-2-enyl-diphosphate synthase n=1 Tax=Daejeonella sp. TaxID=2805397 RepID=UPI003C71EEA8
DGRIKSAVGIGALLEDGLGDTIRVSLTEEPEAEAPVALALANRYGERELRIKNYELRADAPGEKVENELDHLHSPFEYNKRVTTELNTFIGGHQVPRVIIDLSKKNLKDPAILSDVGYIYSSILDKYNMGEQSTDFVYLADQLPSFSFPGNLKQLYNYSTWKTLGDKSNCHPLYTLREYLEEGEKDVSLNLVSISNSDIGADLFDRIPLDNTLVFVLETKEICGMQDQRGAFLKFVEMGVEVPVIVKRTYKEEELRITNYELGGEEPEGSSQSGLTSNHEQLTNLQPVTDADRFQLHSATDIGGLMLDGFGDGIWLDAPGIWPKTVLTTSFGILQATRSRISKTEYISCPSCGRTLFDLQITTQMIRSRTDHLKGLKIGIMGCIVNGPGEMADADYGYVGTGPGKITLYRGKEVVKKNVNTENALDELIGIIKEDGNWVEPEVVNI